MSEVQQSDDQTCELTQTSQFLPQVCMQSLDQAVLAGRQARDERRRRHHDAFAARLPD